MEGAGSICLLASIQFGGSMIVIHNARSTRTYNLSACLILIFYGIIDAAAKFNPYGAE
jgi:hypothetical protein